MKKFSAIYTHTAFLHKPRNINDHMRDEQERGGFNTRVAVGMTKVLSSMVTFWIVGAIIAVWIVANLTPLGWDKMPFPLLLTILNLPQISMMIGLGVGQGVLNRHQELQAEEQYAFVMKSYHELGQLAEHLTSQDSELLQQTRILINLQRKALGED